MITVKLYPYTKVDFIKIQQQRYILILLTPNKNYSKFGVILLHLLHEKRLIKTNLKAFPNGF